MGWPRRGDGYYTLERNNGGGRLPPWEEIPIPKALGDSFPVCDKATRLGVWVCPLTQWRIFPLCWMTQLKIPSFICYNSLWFSPTLFWGLTTPVQCCASMTGEKRPALCSQPSVEDFAEGAVSIRDWACRGSRLHFSEGEVSCCQLLGLSSVSLSPLQVWILYSGLLTWRPFLYSPNHIREVVRMDLPQAPYVCSCRGFDSCWVFISNKDQHKWKRSEKLPPPICFQIPLRFGTFLNNFHFETWKGRRIQPPSAHRRHR